MASMVLMRMALALPVFRMDRLAGVSLVCLPAAVFYLPLIFLAVIMAFLALVISVVKNVMAAAVELREENELTI